MGGENVTNYRFEYVTMRKGIAAELVGFSGGFVKDSTVAGRVITVDYVPLPSNVQIVPLECGVWLPGVQAAK